ncbi:MAG: hypothetical protein NC124_14495 [Clostridium sp.]|nr:hypothetical protein [Clostridium sp.]
MKTVINFEWTRKRRKMLKRILIPLCVTVVLFILCTLIDVLIPGFNKAYMKWPDMLKNLLCLKSWTGHLWFNVWQLFALGYPFYLIYGGMMELAVSVTDEERLETVVYLHNAGISRRTIFLGKGLIWVLETLISCASLLLVNLLTTLMLGSSQMALNMLQHYVLLFLVCLIYLAIALFMAACRGAVRVSEDAVLAVIVLPCLVSRLPALLGFLAALLTTTGRSSAVAAAVAGIGGRIEPLTIVSPLTWCWPAFQGSVLHVIFGVVVFIVMFTAGISIYTHKR